MKALIFVERGFWRYGIGVEGTVVGGWLVWGLEFIFGFGMSRRMDECAQNQQTVWDVVAVNSDEGDESTGRMVLPKRMEEKGRRREVEEGTEVRLFFSKNGWKSGNLVGKSRCKECFCKWTKG
jgi:hypothetical protein